jgi:hypothetical protein
MKQVFIKSYGEESYGIVYQVEDNSFEVYEVPQYGGTERFERAFLATEFAAAKEYACSFT